MSTRKAKIVFMMALSGATLVVVACGGGSEPPISLGSPYEQGPGAFDKPTTSNQDPSPAQKGAPSGNGLATNNPPGQGTSGGTSGQTTSGGTSGQTTSGGTSGQSTSGSTAGCPQCDGMFTCDTTVMGNMQRSLVTLVTKNGACTFSSQGTDVVFACGGTLTANGQNIGTWANCTKSTTSSPPTPAPTPADAG